MCLNISCSIAFRFAIKLIVVFMLHCLFTTIGSFIFSPSSDHVRDLTSSSDHVKIFSVINAASVPLQRCPFSPPLLPCFLLFILFCGLKLLLKNLKNAVSRGKGGCRSGKRTSNSSVNPLCAWL